MNSSTTTDAEHKEDTKLSNFFNEYVRNELSVTLPTICNKIPMHVINEAHKLKSKKLLKNYFIKSQSTCLN